MTTRTADAGDLGRAVALFLCDAGPTELRVLQTRRGTVSGYFTDPAKLVAAARAEDGKGGVYLTLNPAVPEASARADNVVVPYAKHTTGDTEIAGRRWLLVDLDPVRLSGIPSTNVEHDAALALVRVVYGWLTEQGVPSASLVATDSGNGAAILVRVDRPNDDASTALVKRFLAVVDRRFSTTTVKVDCNVFNAARITRLPGTMNGKGSGTADRPHRRARLLHVPDELAICPTEILEAIAALEPEPAARVRPTGNGATGSPLDLPRWLVDHGLTVSRVKPWNGGTLYLLEACPFDASHGANGEVHAGQYASGAVDFACKHDSCTGKTWRDVRDLLEPESRERRESYAHRAHPDAEQANGTASDGGASKDGPYQPRDGSVVLTKASTITPAPVRWLKQDRIPLSELCLVVGMPGDGKSTMGIDDAAHLTRGTLEGDYFGTPVPVAIATAEDAVAAVVVPRLIAAGADLERVHLVHVPERDGITGALVLTNAVITEINALVKAEGIRLLVFDPLVAFLPGSIDTHRDAAVRQILAPLSRYAQESKFTVECIIHLNKAQVQDVLYRVSGSVGFVGAARSVLLVARDPEDPDGSSRILAHAKCNLGPKAPSRRFSIVGHEFDHDGEMIRTSRIEWGDDAPDLMPGDLIGIQDADDRSAREEAVAFLEAFLSTSPNATEATAIYRAATKHGVSARTLQRAKRDLQVESKHDGTTGTWSWRLPKEARTPPKPCGDLAPNTSAQGGLSADEESAFSAESKAANSKAAKGPGDLAVPTDSDGVTV